MTDKLFCDRINLYELTNGTAVIAGFEGIPQNFTVNIVTFLLGFLLFCFLRKTAWNYGRIGLILQHDEKPADENADYNVWTSVNYGTVTNKSQEALMSDLESEVLGSERIERTHSVDDTTAQFDQGLFNWVRFFYVISDKDIKQKAGIDAYHYLLFEKYLIFVTFLIMLLSLCVVLPVNMHGNGTAVKYNDFASTTILNLPYDSYFIWIHAVISFILFLAIISIIWHYASKVNIVTIKEVSNTVIIEGIPKKCSFRSYIWDHFKKAYPECKVIDVQFAHNVKKLININLLREIAVHAKNEALKRYYNTGVRPTMVPKFCGRLSCCAEKVDVIDYYDEEILVLEGELEKEVVVAYENKIGIAFVTFESLEDATKVVEDYQTSCFMPNYPKTSSLSDEVQSSSWSVSYAPPANIINWQNICLTKKKWYIKAFLINSVLFVFVFLLTTPTYVTNILQIKFTKTNNLTFYFNRFIQSFIMWLVSVILPFLVYYSEILVGHWTKTEEHKNVIIKTYCFLIIMVLILPSLGIASSISFIQWLLPNTNTTGPNDHSYLKKFFLQWLCIYAPGNCAFFVNYILTTAFIGTIAELIRIPELAIYLYYQVVVKSSVEMWGIRRNVLWEFQFGLSYAWFLCVFAVTVTYSLICPMVSIFGFIYMAFRYLFDRYNIYFVYGRSYIDAKIHRIALSFTVFPFLLLQINLLVYLRIKGTEGNLIYIFVFISFILSLILYIILTYNGWFTHTKTRELIETKTTRPFVPTTQFIHPFLSAINWSKTDIRKSPKPEHID